MKKIYHLSSCDTCKRIIKTLDLPQKFLRQDLKKEPVTSEELDDLYQLAGTYESLFNKRARLYKEQNLKNRSLTEEDYKRLILSHYTFLKRPVLLNNSKIFIGNNKKTIEEAKLSIIEKL